MPAQTYIDLTDLGEFKTKQDAFNEKKFVFSVSKIILIREYIGANSIAIE